MKFFPSVMGSNNMKNHTIKNNFKFLQKKCWHHYGVYVILELYRPQILQKGERFFKKTGSKPSKIATFLKGRYWDYMVEQIFAMELLDKKWGL